MNQFHILIEYVGLEQLKSLQCQFVIENRPIRHDQISN